MKLFNWLSAEKQETTQSEPSFESHEVRAKRYDDFIHHMDRHGNKWGQQMENEYFDADGIVLIGFDIDGWHGCWGTKEEEGD